MEEPGKEQTGIFKPEDQVKKEEPEKKVLEGDEVPEGLRGKSLDDVAKEREETEKKLQELTKEAEEARKEAETLKSTPPPPPAPVAPPAPVKPFDERFYENPEQTMKEAVRNEIVNLAGPYVVSAGETAVKAQKLELRAEIGDEKFKEYEAQIDQKLASVPSNLKSQPGAVKFTYRALRAQDLDKLESEHKKRQEEAGIREGTDTAGATPGQPPGSAQGDDRSDEQIKIDARLGIKSKKEKEKWADPNLTITVKED